MARNWHLQFDDIFLTSTGDAGGRDCKAVLSGVDAIFNSFRANTTDAADGSPFNESPLTGGGGIALEVQIPSIDTAPFLALKALINGKGLDDVTTITATGEPGSFVVEALNFYNPLPISFGDFSEGTIRNVVLRFKTTEIVSVT